MARVGLLLWSVLLSLFVSTLPAAAQPWTITVTTNADVVNTPWTDCPPPGNNDCSLREAIIVANFNGAVGDTIVFAASLDGTTITLDPSLGSLWIGNESNTTIDAYANGITGITIDANGVQYPVVLAVMWTTIQGPITITNAGAGGVAVVINTSAAAATLDGITVTGNPNVGIGVDSPANLTTITNVTVTNNGGAGISLYGSASTTQISNCTVSNNGGTGIYVAPQNVTIQNCTINNNSNGGISIAASSGLVTIQNSTLNGNIGGSAIFSLAPFVGVFSSIITNNPVGGITLQGSNVGGSLIQFSTISNNGLGIFIGNATGSVDISLNTINNNGGAGVSVRDSSAINIQSNTITSNGQDGISSGVIVVGASSNIAIQQNTIADNGGNGVTILEDFATDVAPQGVRIYQNTINNNGFLAVDGVGIQIAGAVTGVDPNLCNLAGGSVSISANAIYQNAAQGILIERTPAGSNGPQKVCIGIDPVNGGPQNFIYDNVQEGVLLRDVGTSNNIVANSYIGTPDGVTAAPNGNAGVSIYGGATNNIVEGNTIRYNQYQNVLISGVGTTGNIVRNNTIQGGTDVVPRQGYDNAGVVINNGASQNTIGPNNTIQYHYYDGIQVIDLGTDNNQIIQNTITNNGLGVAVLNSYPGTDAQIGPPTPGPANTLIQLNQIYDNNNEGIFIRRDNGGTVIGENQITNNNGEGILLIGSSPSIQNNTITQNAANGILALVYFGTDDSPASANDDVLSQPYNIENNTIGANGGFGIFALDTPLAEDLSTINANNTWSPDNALARIQQDWYGYVRVIDSSSNPVTGLAVQIDQNAPCVGSYTSAVSDPNGNYGPTGFNINSERTYFQVTEAFVTNGGVLQVCTPQTVHDVPTTISGIYAYDGNYPNPPTEQGGAIESPPGSGVDRYQFALLQQPLATADLSISKTDNPDPVLVGNNLTYTITVTNAGPSPATNVVVTDTLPAGVTFVSAVPSQGSCNPPVGNVVTCNLGTLNAGASATITIVVTPTVPGTITNTAEVSSDTADPNPNNNTGQQGTTIEGPLGGDPPIWGTLMVFPAPEQHFGRGPKLDLNRNKSLNDCVLRVRDLQTGLITNTGVFVSCAPRDLDLYEHTVAFVSPEGKLGLYNIATGALTRTDFAASHPGIYGAFVVFEHTDQIALWDGNSVRVLGTGRDPAIWEKFIAFVGPANTIQIYDLTRHELHDTGLEGAQPAIYGGIVAFVAPNHANKKRSVIRLYEIATGRVEETEAVGSWPAIFGRYVVFQTDEAAVNNDLNGDGDRTDTVIRYYDRELRQVFNTALVGAEPDIYDGLIAFWVYESSYGQDLNSDGDKLDPIVQTYRIPTEGISVPLRVTRIALERMDRSSIRFIVQGEGIEAVRVEVYDLQGRVLYRSEFVPGQRVIWYGRAQDGSLLANGVYLAVLTIKGSDRVERSAVQKVVILR